MLWLCPNLTVVGQSASLSWAVSCGNGHLDGVNSIVSDDSGYVYMTGSFRGTVDFDPGAGTFNMSTSGLTDADIFVWKLDANGDFVWAKQLGGNGGDEGFVIALDHSGNIFITGHFSGTFADFDPGSGTFYLSSISSLDVFVTKLTKTGDLIWVKSWQGISTQFGYGLVLDSSGNVHVGGLANGTMDFDPGPAVFNLTAAGSDDGFICVLDSSGSFIHAMLFGGGQKDRIVSIALDDDRSLYSTGSFMGSADFDPGPGTYNLTSNGSWDIFLAKIDSNFNFLWAVGFGSALGSLESGNAVSVDPSGNVLVTGYFSGTTDFDPGPGNLIYNCAGARDVFVSKFSSSGVLLWARQFGITGDDIGWAISSDGNGNVYSGGYFEGPADFDPGLGTYTLSGYWDAFISKLDPNGDFLSATSFGGTNAEYLVALAFGPQLEVYAAGSFAGSCDFDPTAATFYLNSAGITDAFVVKFENISPLPVTAGELSAKCLNGTAVITWEKDPNDSETGGLERSADAIGWEKIAATSIFPMTEDGKIIVIDDYPLPGNSWYRLKRKDIHGKIVYSALAEFQSCKNFPGFTIYPNPTTGNISIYSNEECDHSLFRVFNLNGDVVFYRQIELYPKTALDLSLPEGIYLAEIVCRGNSNWQRIVIN